MKAFTLFLYALLSISKQTVEASFLWPESTKTENTDSLWADAVSSLQSVINLVYQRFQLYDKNRAQLIKVASNMGYNAWDILKLKFAKKLIDGMIEPKLPQTFLMVFGGSSVTAGHDNYYNQSYPSVFERRMAPAFKQLGIDLRIHNIAQGANDCYPSNYCYEAMGGSNFDWMSWEQSFNCGRDRGIFELVARVASANKAVLYFAASGGFIPGDCKPSTDPIPWISEEWTPAFAGITDSIKPSPEQVSEYREELNKWFLDGDSVGRFVAAFGESYKGVGAHGFNFWGHSHKLCFNDISNKTGCDAVDVRGKCYHEGGPHWMTLDGAYYGQTGNVHGRKWHPPVGMHLLRGEFLAYHYSYVLLDAVNMVRRQLKKGKSKNEVASDVEKKLAELQPSMPAESKHCLGCCLGYPVCYTDYMPHYNSKFNLSSLVVRDLESEKRGESFWKYFRRESEGGEDRLGHLDKRPHYISTGANSSVSLVLKVTNVQKIYICGYRNKESLKHAVFYLDPNYDMPEEVSLLGNTAKSYLDGSWRYSASERIEKWTNRKYFTSECTQLDDVPIGNHVLTIRSDPLHPGRTSFLTHVITFS